MVLRRGSHSKRPIASSSASAGPTPPPACHDILRANPEPILLLPCPRTGEIVRDSICAGYPKCGRSRVGTRGTNYRMRGAAGTLRFARRATGADGRVFERAFDESPVAMLLDSDGGTTLRVNAAHRALAEALSAGAATRLAEHEAALVSAVTSNGTAEQAAEHVYDQVDGSQLHMRLTAWVVRGARSQ